MDGISTINPNLTVDMVLQDIMQKSILHDYLKSAPPMPDPGVTLLGGIRVFASPIVPRFTTVTERKRLKGRGIVLVRRVETRDPVILVTRTKTGRPDKMYMHPGTLKDVEGQIGENVARNFEEYLLGALLKGGS